MRDIKQKTSYKTEMNVNETDLTSSLKEDNRDQQNRDWLKLCALLLI